MTLRTETSCGRIGLVAAVAVLGVSSFALGAETVSPKPGIAKAAAAGTISQGAASSEIVMYAMDLPKGSLSEFDAWKDAAAPGGKMVGIQNHGDFLDPPPEDDPHVTFNLPVRGGVPYRCWIHMKVGTVKGKSQANLIYAQFTGAVDEANREILRPRSGSFVTLRGPSQEGWAWVGGDGTKAAPPIKFRSGGEVTVRLQGGMEGVGFDQFVLSSGRFLANPPKEAIVKK